MQNGKSKLAIALFTGFMSLTADIPTAQALSGGLKASVITNEMSAEQKSAYFSGVIEGLAYARYIKDGKNADLGMNCILNWFYETKGTAQKITLALSKFETYSANAVIGALVKKQCGD